MKLTQGDLVLEYLKDHDTITPALMAGKFYKGVRFGSETPRTCRRFIKPKILDRFRDETLMGGKYMSYFKL